MNCPACNGPLAMLFTSTYCPACEKSATETQPASAPYEVVAADCLFVGDDGELWWQRKDGVRLRLTSSSGLGPIISFAVNRSMTSMEMLVHTMRHTMGTGTTHEIIGNLLLPDDVEPKAWSTWMKAP
jgi:hypothetical protein